MTSDFSKLDIWIDYLLDWKGINPIDPSLDYLYLEIKAERKTELKTLFFHSFLSQRKIHESYSCMPQIFATHLCLPQMFVAYSVCPSRMSMPQSFEAFLQGFPMELTPWAIPCCIVRIFEERGIHKYDSCIFLWEWNEKIMSYCLVVCQVGLYKYNKPCSLEWVPCFLIGNVYWNESQRFPVFS